MDERSASESELQREDAASYQRRKREPLPAAEMQQAEALLERVLAAARQKYPGQSCKIDIGSPKARRLYRLDFREGIITYVAYAESRVSLDVAWRRKILRDLAIELGVIPTGPRR